MRARVNPVAQMRQMLIMEARKVKVRSPNGCEMLINRSTDMNVKSSSDTCTNLTNNRALINDFRLLIGSV